MTGAAPSGLDEIGWIDLEFTRTEKLLAIGALMDGRSLRFDDLKTERLRRQSLGKVAAFFRSARYIGGHNLIDFDLPRLARLDPGSPLLRMPVVDTLVLSALAFPRRPYHKLIKDYKLVHDAIGDPVRDCELAQKVAVQTLAQIDQEPTEWKGLLAGILTASAAYAGMAALIQQRCGPVVLDTGPEAMRLLLADRVCPEGLEGLDRILEREQRDVGWAFLLAWLRVAGTGSALPMWVLHRWPILLDKVGTLRGRPCADRDCSFCSTQHDPTRYLARFGIETGFRAEPRAADGKGSLQEAVVRAVHRGESVLAVLPTGAGKSLCYQLPALARYEATGDLTVVVSPLQSLMKDQVDGIEAKLGGRLAEAVSGMLSPVERRVAFERVARGEVALLYLSPEQLRNPSVAALLTQRRIAFWVYDEAHCISKWGHDFRPDYLFVAQAIKRHAEQAGEQRPQVCATTATAKLDVQSEIVSHLRDELGAELTVFDGGSARDNLDYIVFKIPEHSKYPETLDLIRSHAGDGAAIVFASSRKRTEELAAYLTGHGVAAEFFHAGLDRDLKRDVQGRFLDNRIRVICATNAFGMGVDKSDVRLVVHLDVPGSLENYLQEAGRAGRDRLPAKCVLLFTDADLDRQFKLGAYTALSKRDMQQVLRALRRIARRSREGEYTELYVTAGEILSEEQELDEGRETNKVRTAVAWLERRRFLHRNMNRNTVWAGKPTVQNIDEAERKIDRLNLSPDAKARWLAVMNRLLSDGTGEAVSSDELSGCLPTQRDGPSELPGRIMYLLRDMERRGLLEQIATYTLLVDAEVQNDSNRRLGLVKRTQDALLAWMLEQDPDAPIAQALVLDLGQAEAAIRAELRQDPDDDAPALINAPILANMLECIARDGIAWGDGANLLSKRPTGHNKMEILLRVELPRLVELGGRRIALMSEILDAARTRLRASGVKGKGCKVELSLDELKALIDRNLFLSAQVHDQDAAIEDAMYAIQKLGVAQVRGGRTVIRQAMGLRLVESAKSRRFSNQDMQELSTHYREKCVQIHIVGLFARWGAKRISEAMTLVLDYFRLSRRAFLKRYREALGDDVEIPADPAVVDRIVTSLNDADQEAIVTAGVDANLLVLAGPGSGKTRTLVHRIAYLVCIRRIPPWRIFVLTFNRMAAELIRRRLRKLIGQDDAARVRVHTYHALAIRTLGISLDAQAHGDPQSTMELDDLIPLATRGIQGEQSILGIDADQAHEQLLGRVSHLLVDEYQDINLDQYNLVSAITQRVAIEEDARPSIFVVGDDDQNIYAFNGTSTEFIRRFEDEYKADRAVLSSNYRSTANIIDVSQRFIRCNTDRMKREVTLVVDAARREKPPGQPVRIVSLADGESEVGVLLGQLISWADAGVPPGRIAVLARRNNVLHALRRACELQKIPVRLVMPGKGPGRLSRVRECARFLSHLDDLGEETVERRSMLDSLDRLAAGPRKTRWDCLLARLVEAYWAGIGESAAVPASALRGSLLEALHEAGREFTYGEGVFLATVHASKGLEFDRVVIPSSGWRPGKNASEHEEERRLLYVGMTRARHEVVINAAPSHPFGPELAGEGTEKTAPSHVPTPIRIGATQYETLGLGEIHLGYAGYFSHGHAIHAALARAAAESEVELRAESDRVGIYFENIRIGQLSRRAARVWAPRLNTIEKSTIIAVVKRLASQGTMHPERNQCEEWEVPVLEVRRVL